MKGFLEFVLSVTVRCIEDGVVISVVWNWFMPQIFKLPYLNASAALALSLVISLLTPKNYKVYKDDSEKYAELTVSFLFPLIVLVIAWIVKTYFF
jgi:hypothetical protein